MKIKLTTEQKEYPIPQTVIETKHNPFFQIKYERHKIFVLSRIA